MSEGYQRYTKLFSLPENLYSAGAPVIVSAGALQKDSQTGKVFVQLKLHNVQNKVIKAATVTLLLMDTTGKQLADTDFQYLDLTADRETDFGQKTPVPLEEANTRAFSVKVKEVIYADNTTWTDTGEAWEPLAPARTLEEALVDTELVKQFRLEYGPKCRYEMTRDKDLWRCFCGAYNREDEAACASCGLTAEKLENVDLEALAANKDERLAREKEAVGERGKKIKKLVIIGVAAVVVVIAAAVGVNKINHAREINEVFAQASQYLAEWDIESAKDIYDRLIAENDTKKMRYRVAKAYVEGGYYNYAAEAFEELADYKDSAALSEDAKRQIEAVSDAIEKGGTFAELLEALDSSDDYENSAGLRAIIEPYRPYIGNYKRGYDDEMYITSDFKMKDGKVYWTKQGMVRLRPTSRTSLVLNNYSMQDEVEVSDSMEAVKKIEMRGYDITINYTFDDGKINLKSNIVFTIDKLDPSTQNLVFERVEE